MCKPKVYLKSLGTDFPYKENGEKFQYICPGCGKRHVVDNRWGFKFDTEGRPTLVGSVKQTGGHYQHPYICHSFIENGNVRFLNDCTHENKGKTLPMELFEEEENESVE